MVDGDEVLVDLLVELLRVHTLLIAGSVVDIDSAVLKDGQKGDVYTFLLLLLWRLLSNVLRRLATKRSYSSTNEIILRSNLLRRH